MEFNEVVVKENLGLCRCCLSEGCYKDVCTEYTWMNETEIYAEMLMDCFDISIMQHSDGPNGASRLICEVCITRLRDACNFKKQVQETEKKFIDMISKGEFQPKALQEMKSEVEVEVEPETGNTVNAEYLEDEMDFSEAVKEDSDSDYEQPGVSRAATPPKKKRLKKIKIEPPKKGAKILEERATKMESQQKLIVKLRNIDFVLQNSNVVPFKWHKAKFSCFHCNESIQPKDIRNHAKIHLLEPTEAIIWEQLKRNKDVAIKVEVTDIVCNICTDSIPSLAELIDHVVIAHDADYDTSVPNCFLPFKLSELMSCGACDTSFVFFDILLRHANKLHLHHEYACDVCGDSFQGNKQLKMHHRYYHRQGGYVCEDCGISFETISKKLYHDRNIHHAMLTPCPLCSETFKTEYMKKVHLANVHGKDELRIKCLYCDKTYPKVGIMYRHMRRVHLKDKDVECDVCGEKFFEKYDLKLHMNRHIGGKDNECLCPECGQRFTNPRSLRGHQNVHAKRREKEAKESEQASELLEIVEYVTLSL